MAKLIKQLQTQYKRHYRPVVALVVAIIVLVSYVSFVERSEHDVPVATTTEEVDTVTEEVGLKRSSPLMLRVPAIGLETYFGDTLGLNADNTVQVPDSYEEVGWYEHGPTPGEVGPAVVLGHVDSREGPAVFFSLGQLKPGDEILINRADGSTVAFVVTRLERHEQDDFPTDEVYGNVDHPALRLITCTGIYSRSELRYSHNLIVFADMVKE